MDGIFCNNGGALESGMDNSPLYDEDEIRFDTQKSVHKLWDVGLNSLYIHDCEVLAELAGILGKTAEQQELTQRAEKLKQNIKQLWDEKNGFYYNYKTDEHCFSRRISPCNFYPLLTGTPSPQQFERMMNEHFFTPMNFTVNGFCRLLPATTPHTMTTTTGADASGRRSTFWFISECFSTRTVKRANIWSNGHLRFC